MSHPNSRWWRRSVLASVLAIACAPAFNAWAAEATAPLPIRQFVQSVVDQHPDIRVADAQLDAARRRLEAADRPIYNPELSFEYQDTDVREQTIGVSQTIDWSGQRGARTNAARGSLVAAEAEHRVLEEAFIRDLLTTLSDYQIAVSIAELAERRAVLVRRFANIAADRRRAGDLDQVSFDLAVLARAEAEMEWARAESELASRREVLAGFAGTQVSWPTMPEVLPALRVSAEQFDLSALPRIRMATAELDSATATVDLRTRERRPNPTVGLRAGSDGSEDLIGFELSIPLFVRNRYRAEVGEAIANRDATAARLEAAQRTVAAELAGAAARYRAVHDAWRVWEDTGRSSLVRQVETLERLWQLGDMSATDYLIQLRQALDTQETAHELERETWNAWFAWLEHSAGGVAWVGLPVGAL